MTTSPEITLPTIHLNGTSREALVDMYEAAVRALYDAAEALDMSAPNGRDYYTHATADALSKASAEHRSRVARLAGIRLELEALRDHALGDCP